MSHFALLVVTKEDPRSNEGALKAALQPFHEYECTGTLDQYVVEVDMTDECRAEYDKSTVSRIEIDGAFIETYDPRFYREPTDAEREKIGPFAGSGFGGELCWSSRDWGDGLGYRVKVQDHGEHVVQELPVSKFQTFEEYAVDQGYKPRDGGRFVRITNPNSKWDWWVVGGRYSGRMKIKGSDGEHDCAQRSELDLEAMRAERIATRTKMWGDMRTAYSKKQTEHGLEYGITFEEALKEWQAIRREADAVWKATDGAAKREAYNAAIAKADTRGLEKVMSEFTHPFIGALEKEETFEDVLATVKYPLSAFAVLDVDGKWIENGEMGWWGVTSGESMSDAEWADKVGAFIEQLDAALFVTFVDCHI